jgi:shikimate dehydrogenase
MIMEYGLIGEKLGHSYSKEIHEQLADYTYDLCPVSKQDFHRFMTDRDFKAINVTIPYKQDVIPYLDEMDHHAETIGAVNTIVNKDGRLIGHNTDFSGFLYMLKKHNIPVEGKKCLVLGNGGAAKAVVAVLSHLNAKEVLVVSRRESCDTITYEQCLANHSDASLIANTTPVGMYPDTDCSPLDLRPFTRCESVVDVIYNPLETKLTLQAKQLGMNAVTGLEMLVAQALYAVEYFLDTKLDETRIDAIYQELAKQKK